MAFAANSNQYPTIKEKGEILKLRNRLQNQFALLHVFFCISIGEYVHTKNCLVSTNNSQHDLKS